MGEVYRAWDSKLGRDIAIKVVTGGFATDPEHLARFRREAHLLATLNHPHIGAIYGFEDSGDVAALILELVDGETLADRVSSGPLPVGEALRMAREIAAALGAAHEKGIVHRDLKPANIKITPAGLVKVLDFGLAKASGPGSGNTETIGATREGLIVGTVAYMSPEQARGQQVDKSTDVWAFGCVLYEMLTRRPAFAGRNIADTLAAIVRSEPDWSALPDDVPEHVRELLRKCLEKDRARRLSVIGAVPFLIDATGVPRRRQRQARLAVATSLIAMVSIAVGTWVWTRPDPAVSPSAPGWERVAILPLENLSGDTAEDYFADGVTEALTTELAQISALSVIARDSVMRFKRSTKTSSEIAAELDVDAVVRGSVIHGNESVRVTAQLVDPDSGRLLWTRSYVRPTRDSVTLLGEIAATIAHELNVELAPAVKGRLARPRPVRPEANVAYLKGRFHLNRITEDGYLKSIEFFEEAVTLDASFAPAHAGLARAYQFLRQIRGPKDVVPKIRAATERALALDPDLAEAHTLLAQLKLRDSDVSGAEAAHRRALQLNPSDPLAFVPYAAFLNQVRRHEEALAAIRRAEELDPLSPFVSANVILRLNALGRFEDSLKQAARAQELKPDFWLTQDFLAGTYWRMKRPQDAIRAWEKAIEMPGAYPAWMLAPLSEAYLADGRPRDAQAALSRLARIAETGYVEPVVLARAYAGMKQPAKALDVLERAYREHDLEGGLRMQQLERLLGNESRFQALLRTVDAKADRK